MADILLTPSAFTVGSASTTVTAFFSGATGTCGFDCDSEQRTGTWPNNNPGYHSENWTGVTSTSSDGTGYYSVTLPDNDTNATRTLTLDMIMSSGANCENTFNPQTIEITQLATASASSAVTATTLSATTSLVNQPDVFPDMNKPWAVASAVSCCLRTHATPKQADLDLVYTIGHNDISLTLSGSPQYRKETTSYPNYSEGFQLATFNSTVDGYAEVTVTDRISNLSKTYRIYNRPSGSTSSPRFYFNPSAITVPYENITTGRCATGVQVDMTLSYDYRSYCYISGDTWDIAGRPVIDNTNENGNTYLVLRSVPNNSGGTRDITQLMVFHDTNYNSFITPFDLTQQASGTTPATPGLAISGSPYMTLDATGSCNSLPIVATNCIYSSFTADIEYNPNLSSHSTATVTEQNGNIVFCLTSNPLSAYTEVAIVTLRLYDTSGNSYLYYCSLDQYGSSEPSPTGKTIVLRPEVINASSADTAICTTISAVNCTYSSYTITSNGGQHYTSGPIVNGNQMCFTFQANTGSSRSETFGMQLFDTEGNSYNTFLVVSQGAKGNPGGNTPDPWSDTGDTAYTWYKDDNLLRILPSTKILAATEETGYWPVTAHTFNDVGVRASGDVVFTYELVADGSPEYNSHSLYAYTQDNTGTTQLVSTIKLVAFSGTSAYSASTVLMKNPDSHGWITASPNPVNAPSQQNSVSVFLTLTNCQRNVSKETTDNVEFNEATWVTVTRVNNTALTFNFQENTSPQSRSTYYYAYGLDTSGNNVYCRIELIQSANSMGITITPDRSSLGKPAGSFTARVESTENGTFSFSASPWMSITSYVPSSSKGGTLYVDYYQNDNEWPRTGNIWVTQQISTSPYVLTATTQLSQTNTADTAYIIITPSTISVPRTAGEVEAQVSYGGLATAPVLVEGEGNMSIVSYSLDSTFITVAYGANDTSMDKNKTFTVTAMSANGNVISATFTLTQGGTGLPVAPIWRDYVLSLPVPGQGYINYNVSFDGTVVYTGRAYSMGQEDIELYYNHICKPFLSNHIDFTGGFQSIRDWLGNFIITSPELGDITSVSFFEDYSYENRTMTNLMTLNNPIINEVVDGAYVPFSFFVTGSSGTVNILANGQQLTGLTVNDNEQHRYFVEAQLGTTYHALGVTYKTIDACEARYSLYYINSYGGVDVLPFKGRSFKKTDTITRMNYSRSFRNNTLEFENVNYMNEIKPAWELNTSYMVDSQSRKMHELVESTCVYLYDAEEQTYTPVVMTDKKLEYKTYFNQGRKFYTYTINVEESQSKERR